jgi:hypothetical protein
VTAPTMTANGTTPSQVQTVLAEMAAEVAELKRTVGGSITETLAGWLTPQYVLAARDQLAAVANGAERWKVLRCMAGDLTALRRGDQWAERLQLERERLELLREANRKNKEEEFEEWLKRPEVRDKVHPKHRRDRVIKRVQQIIEHVLMGNPLPEFEYIDDEEPEPQPDPAAMI